jgi:hypothetical protein
LAERLTKKTFSENVEGVSRTGCLGEYLGPGGMTLQGGGENCIMRCSMIYTLHQILLGWSNQGGWGLGETRNAYKILIRKPEGKKPF